MGQFGSIYGYVRYETARSDSIAWLNPLYTHLLAQKEFGEVLVFVGLYCFIYVYLYILY